MNRQTGTHGFLKLLLAMSVFFAVLFVGISSKTKAPEYLGALIPDAAEITYVSVTAEGTFSGSGVTRDPEKIAEWGQILAETALEETVDRYVGKQYEGTLYTIRFGYENQDYSIVLSSDGSVFHSNGKLHMKNCDTLCQWLNALCTEG